MSDLITPPLDPTRPLWHVYLIEGFGEGCALLFRIHHCIADGIALARVMLSLTDAEPDVAIAAAPAARERGAGGRTPGADPASPGALSTGGEWSAPSRMSESNLLPAARRTSRRDRRRDTGTLAKHSRPGSCAPPLRGSFTAVAGWRATPFPLDRVKRAGRRSGATVDDVLMAA